MRPDGKRVKGLTPIVSIIPYIMPQRYDAQNTVTEYIDEEIIKKYIREKRRGGTRLNHMAVIMAAYYKAVLKNPKLNYFIMNRKIYERNHFCVSFVMLKKRADGTPDETTLKIYLQPNDTVFTINDRIQEAIAQNANAAYENKTDKFVSFLVAVPGLVRFVVWLARNLDKIGLLPRFVIELSPFHTSLFITNLASIKTSFIHHHCYEFGTTSVFICMGKPVPGYAAADLENGKYPPAYYVQCVHYLAVTGYERWYLAIMVLGRGFYIFTIERDQAEIDALMEQEKAFWENHVLTNIPPSPDGMEATTDALGQIYPNDSAPDTRIDEDTLCRYEEIRQEMETLGKQLEENKQRIMLQMAESERGYSDSYTVQWKKRQRTTYDMKKFIREHPEIDMKQYQKITEYRQFNVKE